MKRSVFQYKQSQVKFFKVKVEHHATLEHLALSLALEASVELCQTDELEEIETLLNRHTRASVMKLFLDRIYTDGDMWRETNQFQIDEADVLSLYITTATNVVSSLYPELI
jgi:hypothetical protein